MEPDKTQQMFLTVLEHLNVNEVTDAERWAIRTLFSDHPDALAAKAAFQSGVDPGSVSYIRVVSGEDPDSLYHGGKRILGREGDGWSVTSESALVPLILWPDSYNIPCQHLEISFEADWLGTGEFRSELAAKPSSYDWVRHGHCGDMCFTSQLSFGVTAALSLRIHIDQSLRSIAGVALQLFDDRGFWINEDAEHFRVLRDKELKAYCGAVEDEEAELIDSLADDSGIPVCWEGAFDVTKYLGDATSARLLVLPDTGQLLSENSAAHPVFLTKRATDIRTARRKLGDMGHEKMARGVLLSVGQRDEQSQWLTELDSYKSFCARTERKVSQPTNAEDIEQGVQVGIQKSHDQGDFTPLVARHEDDIARYLNHMFRNETVNWLRKAGRTPELLVDQDLRLVSDDEPTIASSSTLMDAVLDVLYSTSVEEQLLRRHDLIEHVQKVDPKLIEVLTLRLFEGRPVTEVAGLLNVNRSTVHRHWEQLVEILRKTE